MNDVHALGKLCCYWEGGQERGDQVLKNAWRIRRTFPKRPRQPLHPVCSRALGPSGPGNGLSAPPAPRSAIGAAGRLGLGRQRARARALVAEELRPAFLSFLGRRRRLAAGLRPRPRNAPAPPAPPLTPPPPPAEILGDGGGRARRPGGRGSAPRETP